MGHADRAADSDLERSELRHGLLSRHKQVGEGSVHGEQGRVLRHPDRVTPQQYDNRTVYILKTAPIYFVQARFILRRVVSHVPSRGSFAFLLRRPPHSRRLRRCRRRRCRRFRHDHWRGRHCGSHPCLWGWQILLWCRGCARGPRFRGAACCSQGGRHRARSCALVSSRNLGRGRLCSATAPQPQARSVPAQLSLRSPCPRASAVLAQGRE